MESLSLTFMTKKIDEKLLCSVCGIVLSIEAKNEDVLGKK